MLSLLRVSGNSMLPAYRDGDFVLVSKIPYFFCSIEPGDVIAFRHQSYGTLIKVVGALSQDSQEITVAGTHPDSAGRDVLGPVIRSNVLGKVIWHVGKPAVA